MATAGASGGFPIRTGQHGPGLRSVDDADALACWPDPSRARTEIEMVLLSGMPADPGNGPTVADQFPPPPDNCTFWLAPLASETWAPTSVTLPVVWA